MKRTIKGQNKINKTESKTSYRIINETKVSFFEKICKADRTLIRISKRIEKSQINEITEVVKI